MRPAASRRPSRLGRSKVWLLRTIVEDVILCVGVRVEDDELARGARHRRNLIPLLAESLHLRASSEILSLMVVRGNWAQTHSIELLGCSRDVQQLLLEFSLLLCKAGIRSQQFPIQALIELSSVIVDLDSWRSKYLLGAQVHLLINIDGVVVACSRKESARGCLRDSSAVVGILRRRISATLEAKAIIAGRYSGRFGCGPQTRQHMTTTSAGRGANICLLGLIDGGDLWRSNTQSLDMGSLSARGEPRPRYADGVVIRGLICHLSKTASVHAHIVAC